MIDHIVEHQIIVFRKPLHIRPVTERRLDPVIVHRGKTAVAGRRKKRQNMHASDCLFEISLQKLPQFVQILPHGVGVGNQHTFIFQFFHILTLLVSTVMISLHPRQHRR